MAKKRPNKVERERLKTIGEVDLTKGDNQMDLFDSMCEGYCGN